jgi:hypothetical protein
LLTVVNALIAININFLTDQDTVPAVLMPFKRWPGEFFVLLIVASIILVRSGGRAAGTANAGEQGLRQAADLAADTDRLAARERQHASAADLQQHHAETRATRIGLHNENEGVVAFYTEICEQRWCVRCIRQRHGNWLGHLVAVTTLISCVGAGGVLYWIGAPWQIGFPTVIGMFFVGSFLIDWIDQSPSKPYPPIRYRRLTRGR